MRIKVLFPLAATMDSIDISVVAKLRKDGLTYEEISAELQQLFPNSRGFSERIIRQCCIEHSLKRKLLQKLLGR